VLTLEIVLGVAGQYVGWLHGRRRIGPRYRPYAPTILLAGLLIVLALRGFDMSGDLLAIGTIWVVMYGLGYMWGRAARISAEMTPAERDRT
jgi:hypothetical protein